MRPTSFVTVPSWASAIAVRRTCCSSRLMRSSGAKYPLCRNTAIPAPASRASVSRYSVVVAPFGEVLEARIGAEEGQAHHARRAVALLADDHLGHAAVLL